MGRSNKLDIVLMHDRMHDRNTFIHSDPCNKLVIMTQKTHEDILFYDFSKFRLVRVEISKSQN